MIKSKYKSQKYK